MLTIPVSRRGDRSCLSVRGLIVIRTCDRRLGWRASIDPQREMPR